MEAIDATFNTLSQSVGFPPDQLKYLVCLFTAIPLAQVFRLVGPGKETVKHVFSIVVSIFFCEFCLGHFSWLHSFISSTVCYLIMKTFPHGVAHKAVFVVSFLQIQSLHISSLVSSLSPPILTIFLSLPPVRFGLYFGEVKDFLLPLW